MKYIKNYNTFVLENSDYSYNYSNQELDSLIQLNIPEIVNEDFDCSENNLTSLEGAPKVVHGDFACYNNKLKNLDFLPDIKGELICFDNDWEDIIPFKIVEKYNLNYNVDFDNYDNTSQVYTQEQYYKFGTLEYQKEYLKKYPENFMELKPFGYADGLEELYPHLFDMNDLGLID